MCGIAGIISEKSSELNLSAMLAAMKHRGPDDSGKWIQDNVYLGHNRLSIIDLSSSGHQPMVSQSGRYIIVYNGEVYNFKTLRKQLTALGVKFRSETDTEVILELWEKEGPACIELLRGMFAFAVWDKLEKSLTLVRDRLGIKPLFYSKTSHAFIFSSEIKGIIASGFVDTKINEIALALALQKGYVQHPHTILSDVYALLPGHFMRLHKDEIVVTRYWQCENHQNKLTSEVCAISAVRELVIEAAREEMISDRPIGIFLSGGLDSTILLAALKAGGESNIKTFTVGFDSTDKKLSEASDAKETARFYESDHHEIEVEGKCVWESLDAFVEAIDQPSVDGLNTWLVSRETSKHVTVALSGLGGDELFSGYSLDRKMLHWRENKTKQLDLLRMSEPFWNQGFVPGYFRKRLNNRNKFNDFMTAYLSWGSLFAPEEAACLTSTSAKFQREAVRNVFDSFDTGSEEDLLQRITTMHLNTFMGGRLLRDSDAVAMSHSLEVRFPLIDHRLVELANSLPQNWRIKEVSAAARMKNFEIENSYEKTGVKHLLYQAFKDDLPKNFNNRSKKGFKLPINQWLKMGLEKKLEPIFYNPASILNRQALMAEWQNWKAGTSSWSRIWIIALIEMWAAKYVKN